MNRYVIKFSKEDAIRYISHLDLLRLFKRSFKRAGIKLQHSQGFNPHPKMSFAQPLSLGYTSTGEYLEFETAEECAKDDIVEKISAVMPDGITVISCEELPSVGKTLAALTVAAGYEIRIPLQTGFEEDIIDVVTRYMKQDRIEIIKHQKKTGRDVEVDIKPMIRDINGCMVDNNNIMLSMKLAAGSAENLSPEMVLVTFCNFAGIQYDRAEILICRNELYFSDKDRVEF